MRILALAPQWPDPPRQGAAIRNLYILRYLAKRHNVTLLTFQADGPMETSALGTLCERAEVLPAPTRTRGGRILKLATSSLPDMAWRLHSDAMTHRLEELCRTHFFDAIHIEGIEMAPYGLLAARLDPLAHMVYDAHNAEYLLQRRAFTTDLTQWRRLPRALYSLLQWWRLRRFERDVVCKSHNVIAVSPADVAALSRLSLACHRQLPRTHVTLLPNGVDPAYWAPQAVSPEATMSAGDALVFDGTMDFRPNVDAVLWFASEVWPLVRQERPEAHFYIVGRNPAPEVCALGDKLGVTVTGAVEDTRPWVAGASVYVVPMRMGGGVRLKVLQAMAMARAIVSTQLGAEGITARPGIDMLLARTPAEFAASTLHLLQDPQRRQSLGASARELVTERYAWPKLLPTLDRIYHQ